MNKETDYKKVIYNNELAFLDYFPDIQKPVLTLNIGTRLKYTIISCLIYILLTSIPIYGVIKLEETKFRFNIRLEGNSIAMAGRSAKFMADIFMTLLMRYKILEITAGLRKTKNVKQKLSNVLAYILLFSECYTRVQEIFNPNTFVFNKWIVYSSHFYFKVFVFFQLYVGGLLILLLENMLDKYGLGASKGYQSMTFFILIDYCRGITDWIFNLRFYERELQFKAIYSIIYTLCVVLFAILIYEKSIKIKLVHQNMRGVVDIYELKYLYCESHPLLLLTMFKEFITNMLRLFKFTIGVDIPENVFEYLSGSNNFYELYLNGYTNMLLFEALYLLVGIYIMSYVWINVTGLGSPETIAEQILENKLTVQYVRPTPLNIATFFKKHIDTVLVIGSGLLILLTFLCNIYPLVGNTNGSGLLILLNNILNLKNSMKKEKQSTIGKVLYDIHSEL